MTPGQLIKVLLDCRMYVQKLTYWIVVILGDIINLSFADDFGKKEAHGRGRLGQLASMGQEGHGRGLQVP
jgi:hypothetical protein